MSNVENITDQLSWKKLQLVSKQTWWIVERIWLVVKVSATRRYGRFDLSSSHRWKFSRPRATWKRFSTTLATDIHTRYFSQAALSARITMPVKLRKTRAITFFADNYGCHITTIRCYKRSISRICMNRVRRTPSFLTKRFYFIPQRFLDAPCVILLINLTQSPAIDVTPCS